MIAGGECSQLEFALVAFAACSRVLRICGEYECGRRERLHIGQYFLLCSKFCCELWNGKNQQKIFLSTQILLFESDPVKY